MNNYAIHTPETAPEGSREVLRNVRDNLGGVPNLAAMMAESPTLLRAFFTVREIYASGTLTGADIQVLSIANAVENDCDWCVAFHSMLAKSLGVGDDTISSLRAGTQPNETRARALSDFTRLLTQQRGNVSAEAVQAFRSATGFTAGQVLEVVLGVAFSTMANYAQHIVNAPLDAMLEPFAVTAAH